MLSIFVFLEDIQEESNQYLFLIFIDANHIN